MAYEAVLHGQEQKHAWELRTAWALRRPVVLTLSERAEIARLEGLVERVAVTGAFVVLDGWHVPTIDILAVHKPHSSQHTAAVSSGSDG